MTATDALPLPAARARARATENGATAPPKSLWRRLADIAGEVKELTKGGTAPQVMGGFKFVEASKVGDELRGLFSAHGVAVNVSMPECATAEAGKTGGDKPKTVWRSTVHLVITLRNADDPSQTEVIDWWGTGDDTGDKGVQKAATNALKYALMKQFLLGGADDTDAAAHPTARAAGASTQGSAQRRPPRKVALESRACPDCGEQLFAIYRDNGGTFVGHKDYPPKCKWMPDNETRSAYLHAAGPDPDPPKGPHSLPAGQQATFDYVGALKVIHEADEEKARTIFEDKRFTRTEGEKVGDWLARLEQSQRAELRMVIEAALAQTEIPL